MARILDFDINQCLTEERTKLAMYQKQLKELRQLSRTATDEEIDILKQMLDLQFVKGMWYDDMWLTVARKASEKQIVMLMREMLWNDENFWPTLVQCCDAYVLSDVIIAEKIIMAAAKVYLLGPSITEQNLVRFYEYILQSSPYAESGQKMFVNTPDALTCMFEAISYRLQADMEKGENLQEIETSDIIEFIKNKISRYISAIERGLLPRLKSACRELIDLVHRIQSMNLASEQAKDKKFLGALYNESNKSYTIAMDHPRDM